jgi:adenylate kinase family enzyme
MRNIIIHISGCKGAGKTTLGNKLKEKYYKTYHADTKIPIPKELKFSNSNIVNIITIKPIINI